MALPAGYSSDEDDDLNRFDFGGYEDENAAAVQHLSQNEPIIEHISKEEQLNKLLMYLMNGRLAEIITLFDNGIPVNVKLTNDWTPLLLAASIGNLEITDELIKRGADVNEKREMYTVLMAACSCPETTSPTHTTLAIVQLLIEHGADVKAITRKRMTALMYAAKTGNLDVVNFLLPLSQHDAEDNQGWTALFWAVNENQPHVVQFLLEVGFSYERRDIRGNLPLYYAVSQDFEDVIALFPSKAENDPTPHFEEAFHSFQKHFEVDINQKPVFLYDLYNMLCSMKCDKLITLFMEKNICMADFLLMDNEDLKEIGVVLPFQRARILNGLYKFHNHPFRQKSLPVVPKNVIYSTTDISLAIVAVIRQIMTMEASIKYITKRYDIKPFKKQIALIREKILRLKRVVTVLHASCKKWDDQIRPVDVIHKNSKPSAKTFRWWKFSVLAIIVGVAGKKFYSIVNQSC